MSNVVYKLTNPEIQQLMSKINCDTSKLPQGMKAKAKYKNTSISIYNSNKVMFQGKEASVWQVNCYLIMQIHKLHQSINLHNQR